MKKANVLIFRGVNKSYSYTIPAKNVDIYQPGTHVEVPFGNSVAAGLIISIEDKKTIPRFLISKMKSVKSVLTKLPKLNPDLIELINWFSDHYHTTPFKAYQTIVGNRKLRTLEESPGKTATKQPVYELTEDQKKAIETILAKKKTTFLLHGVTASGKTEVYMQVAQKMLAENKQALILLPEIALTPQYTRIFKERFGHDVAVLHSGLTPKEREIEWSKIYLERVNIVIGPRSAVFAPLKNIGVIIIDEEHESSYKQENNPRYLTHSVAEYRRKQHNSILIFGSATPCIETYGYADSNKIELLKLKKRVHNQPMPPVEIVDMRQELISQNNSPISRKLKESIEACLSKKGKAMILINRRGYAPYIVCQKCGEIYTCPQCNLSFTYHKDKKFRCHRCQITADITHTCRKCNKNMLSFSGLGIQKAEIELIRMFPDANILRLDRDTAKTAGKLEEILTKFQKEGDILIGTQLIAKGHHIEEVTLVGVLGIDTTLNIPDFRSPERTFQLLTQVAGRSGRSHKQGLVIVQTYEPDHYAIQHATTHNFESFYAEEIEYRKALWYPPFSSLINIIFSSKNEDAVKKLATKTHTTILKAITKPGTEVQISPAKPAPIEKIKDHFRWNILIKSKHEHISDIKIALKKLPEPPSNVRLIIDFDPRSIL